jgi:hypothetical protein
MPGIRPFGTQFGNRVLKHAFQPRRDFRTMETAMQPYLPNSYP